MKTDHYAIVVGIDTYPGFTNLEGPCHDAEAMRGWLVDPQGGDVDPGNVRLLRGSEYPEPNGLDDARPHDAEIRALFRPLLEKGLRAPFIGERLYIYMAGHGFMVVDPVKARLTGLYAANAGIALAPNLVATVYAEWFRLNAVFHEIVLIMDCCRTPDLLHDLAEPALVKISGRTGLSRDIRYFYAYATQEGQVARERSFDGQARGIFTATLLQAFEKAPPNRLGRVNGSTIRDYVHHNIHGMAGDVEVDPPDIDGPERGEIVFATRETETTLRVTFRPEPPAEGDEVVVFQRPEEVLDRLAVVAPTVQTTLEPGFYKARLDDAGREKIFEVGLSDVEISL